MSSDVRHAAPGVHAVDSPFGRLWSIPLAYWAYGLVRPLAFFAPAWSDGGSVGMGLVLTGPLYVMLLRGSMGAWLLLVALDSLALLGVLVFTESSSAVVPLLTGVAWSLLLTPRVLAMGHSLTTQTSSESNHSTDSDHSVRPDHCRRPDRSET